MELPEGNLNILGLQLIFDPKTSEQGINILLLATGIYPDSANLFDSLAEAYLYVGNKEKAIENFDKSLELNSQNQNAIDRLKQLRK
jgi:predicted Zn-dependent protease